MTADPGRFIGVASSCENASVDIAKSAQTSSAFVREQCFTAFPPCFAFPFSQDISPRLPAQPCRRRGHLRLCFGAQGVGCSSESAALYQDKTRQPANQPSATY